MAVSRRKFLKAGSLAALVAGIPLNAASLALGQRLGDQLKSAPTFPIPDKSQQDVLNYFTKATFTPYLETQYRVRLNASQVMKLKLVEVRELKVGKQAAKLGTVTGREGFALVFVGLRGSKLESKIYTVEHDALGKFSLFLSPVDMGRVRPTYEAIINRLP